MTLLRLKALQAEITALEKQLKTWSYHYYVKNQPLVADAVYDYHYQRLLRLANAHPNLIAPTSITKTVGFKPVSKLKLINHQTPLLSLDNAFNFADLSAFDAKIKKTLAAPFTYHCELKVDGLPVNLSFRNHFFVHCATRGDGTTGEDVTTNFLTLQNFATLLAPRFPWKNFDLRGEVYMSKQQFGRLNQTLKTQLSTAFANDQKSFSTMIKTLQRAFPAVSFNPIFPAPIPLDRHWNHAPFYTFTLNCSLKGSGSTSFLAKLSAFLKAQKYSFYKQFKPLISDPNTVICHFEQTTSLRFFLNPRNAAAGSLRQLDPAITERRNLAVAFFHFETFPPNSVVTNQAASLKYIAQILKFPVVEPHQHCETIEAAWKWIQKLQTMRAELPFQIDGIVIKVNEFKHYDKLGTTAKFPRYAIAYKFPDELATSTLLKIQPTVGRTGKIAFIAHLSPTFLQGSLVQRATLHNANFIQSLDLRIHDVVLFKKAGGIIPKIIGVKSPRKHPNTRLWRPPTHCPACQTNLTVYPQEVDQYCLNWRCPAVVLRRLEYFVSRSAYDIKGLSKQTLQQFYDLHLIADGADLFYLLKRRAQLENLIAQKRLVNFQTLALNNLFAALKAAQQKPLSRLLVALGVHNLGSKAAQILATHFQSFARLQAASAAEWYNLKGVGPKLYENWRRFFANPDNHSFVEKLLAFPVTTVEPQIAARSTFWANKTVVITGTFPLSRAELKHQLLQLGSNVTTSVSSQTDFLLCGANPGQKQAQAKALKIPCLDWPTLKKLLQP